MTVFASAALFTATVILLGVCGPYLVRASAPALMRIPRLAALALAAVLMIWLLAAAAIGPMLAWTVTGPSSLMPQRAGEVCQRCLDAASPLGFKTGIETGVPAAALLAAPAILLAALAVSAVRSVARRRSSTRALCRSLKAFGPPTTVQGFEVTVVTDQQLSAYALPRSCRGIVVSQALLEALTPEELHAVLRHEQAHLNQRHHLILAVVEGLSRPLRWVPLIRGIADAIPHYLEVAADNAALQKTGTAALASALLKLGDTATEPVSSPGAPAVTLHAAGTDRIRQLVAPCPSRAATASAAGILTTGLVLMISSAAVHLPYAQAVVAGCLHH